MPYFKPCGLDSLNNKNKVREQLHLDIIQKEHHSSFLVIFVKCPVPQFKK